MCDDDDNDDDDDDIINKYITKVSIDYRCFE